jgi:hypothetical protein
MDGLQACQPGRALIGGLPETADKGIVIILQ